MSNQMRFSEAIRLGSMLRPQFFGRAIGRLPDGTIATCANGAALEAAGAALWFVEDGGCVRVNDGPTDEPPWGHFAGLEESCPIPGCMVEACSTIAGIAGHLNDDHRWTREQIADWAESLEAKHLKPAREREPVCV